MEGLESMVSTQPRKTGYFQPYPGDVIGFGYVTRSTECDLDQELISTRVTLWVNWYMQCVE